MKVDNPYGALINSVASGNSKTGKNKESLSSFSEILENTKSDKHRVAGATSSLDSIASQVNLSTVQRNAISRGEATLTLLNHLAGLLEKSSGSTSIESVASALDSSSNELMAMKNKLHSGDPLRKTLDQIAILSVVEKIKITRGDYS